MSSIFGWRIKKGLAYSMTLAKKKYRYACIYLQKNHDGLVYSDFLSDFYKRLFELCGSIDFHKTNVRVIDVDTVSKKFLIIKCKLDYVDNVLLSMYFTNYPIMILPISGTIKQLKKRVRDFLLYEGFLLGV
jgi:RNase P/RNase MRP subunit POP5